MEAMLVAGTLVQAAGQIGQAQAQADALESQAAIREAQTEQRVALEKARAAEESVDRARQFRKSIGNNLARVSSSGIGLGSGSVGDVAEDSGAQFAREQGISNFNLGQRVSSARISSQADVNSLTARASNTRVGGYVRAAGTLMNAGQRHMNRGSVPSGGGG